MEGIQRVILLVWCWIVQRLRSLFSCVKNQPQLQCEEKHKLLLANVPLIEFDVVHKVAGETLDRRGKPLAASAYNLNLTSLPITTDSLSKENEAHMSADMRSSCHVLSTPRTSSEKAVSFTTICVPLLFYSQF
ncbi:hypothetical protein GCK32_022286 [Trichostrongylus colubriformis]|uniref:Uncharacterized protein n=1 Tax=Trichostrongylus colubriformis TaxID=6319 RepID=A0AAN8J318_TRICO